MRIYNNGSISLGANNTNITADNVYVSTRLGIKRTNPLYPLHVGTTTSNGNGAHVTNGGTWTNGSSRLFKDNFTNVNSEEILQKLASLKLTKWNYSGSDEGFHLGPIAEEFYEAFGLGNNPQYISTV